MFEQLMEAVKNGDVTAMRVILDRQPELANETAPDGESPLIAALYRNQMAAVELLLERGASVTIHEAAALDDADAAAQLLDLEPGLLREYSYDGWTPLHLACFFGAYDTARLLLERGADVHVRSRNGMNNCPIHAAAAGKRTALVHLLLEHGADPNARQRGGWTPVHQAAAHCDAGMVELLLHYGGDPDLRQDEGKSARSIAEENGFSEVLAVLERS